MIKSFFLYLFICQAITLIAPVSFAEEEKSSSYPAEESTDYSSKKKKILDTIRQGVVIIQVKAFASTSEKSKTVWSGTGFIVDKKNGLIATNKHVTGDLSVCSYTVKFADGSTTEAYLRYADPLYDFAFLAIDPTKLSAETMEVELNDKSANINDNIYAMGNSMGDEFSTFRGTISSIYENIGPFAEQSFKFSGLTAPGASGSPVFDQEGKVIGIIYGGKITSGLALPIKYIKEALSYLKKGDTPPRKSLGIICKYGSLEDVVKAGMISEKVKGDYIKAFPKSNNRILMINNRMVGSLAQEIFQAGDILWSINNTLIGPDLYKIDEMANDVPLDEDIKIQVYRQGELKDLKVKPYSLSLQYYQHLITFADATWFEANEFVRLMVGDSGPGVYIKSPSPTSSFKNLLGESLWMDERILKITSINGISLTSLENLKKVITTLKKKTILIVKYIDFLGAHNFGNYISADRQEKVAILKYESQFDNPKEYQLDEKTLKWKATDIESIS